MATAGEGKRRRSASPASERFDPRDLDRSVIALPLLFKIKKDRWSSLQEVIIDLHLEYPGGREEARRLIYSWIEEIAGKISADPESQGLYETKSNFSQQYIFARLSGKNIRKLIEKDVATRAALAEKDGKPRAAAIYRIWLDHEVQPFCNVSVSAVKADAARRAFGAFGKEVVWAVIDTGISRDHPHFKKHDNLTLKAPLRHCDFTRLDNAGLDELEKTALVDDNGHGTHVAGIIAGEFTTLVDGSEVPDPGRKIHATVRERQADGEVRPRMREDIEVISGMAPQCKLLSLKALDKAGGDVEHPVGRTSSLLVAIDYIQKLNSYGRHLLIHGVNISVGYDFEPKWFACGQSPLCVEVDRLVRSGVVVVVAAGNTGYGNNNVAGKGPNAAGLDVTINDPGNADLAITVGSTHREMPHIYGVSYFSSKGPTGDGRLKPDLVAPGEKIISCDAAVTSDANNAHYKEDSGTSMAAPHVSGVIAAFLSIRREFIGRPERVKDIFMSTATDLRRATYFQGKGMVDLMRAIQSV